jgi:ubiquinone/menaquinone biosynthesis C-methylase UbiE
MVDHSPDRADEVRQLFNTRAAAWSAFYAPGGNFTGRLALFNTLITKHVPAGGRMLDLGCGSGEIARAGAAAGLRVTGCDISELMLRSAISRDPQREVEWVQLDTQWRRLPFATGSFDAVVAASVLEYVDEPSVVLSECARILRPGGLLACTVPDPRHPVRWLESVVSPCGRVPAVGVAARRWPRLENHLTYLQTSRQRHMARWWRAAARQAGLVPGPRPVNTGGYSRLRLLTFKRPHQGD